MDDKCEIRWNSQGESRLQTGETLIYSSKENKHDRHESGESRKLSKEAAQSLLKWEPVTDG